MSVSSNDLRIGMRILIENEPYSIVENDFVKPGKGQAFNRMKIRHLKTGRLLEKTLKSSESVDLADVQEVSMQFLFRDETLWHLMKMDGSFEQYACNEKVLQDDGIWMKEEELYDVTLWNNDIISVIPPKVMILSVAETEPGLKGDTVTGGSKAATLSTGAVINVPLFINIGEMLRVDTREKKYVSRA